MKNSSRINYETQWQNEYLSPPDYLTFKANTPIEDIIPQLEKHLNQCVPDLNVNYQKYATSSRERFRRLYRNLVPNYKGWQVQYREPGSTKNYGLISERISFRPRQSKPSLQRMIFKQTMLWTHELYPLIDSVEIKGAASCKTIAQRLNGQLAQPRYLQFFSRFELSLDSLFKNSKKLGQDLTNLDRKPDNVCDEFTHDLETLNFYHKQLQSFLNKDYQVLVYNVRDLLRNEKNLTTTKGWRVEFV